MSHCRRAGEHIVDYPLAVNSIHHRLAHSFILKLREQVVDREVIHRRARVNIRLEARIGGKAQIILLYKRPDTGVGLTHIEGNRPNRRFWHDIQADIINPGPTPEVIVECPEQRELSGPPLHKLKGTSANGSSSIHRLSNLTVVMLRDNVGCRRYRYNGCVRHLHVDDNGVVIRRLDPVNVYEAPPYHCGVGRIPEKIPGVLDVRGCEGGTIMKLHASPKVERNRQTIRANLVRLSQDQTPLIIVAQLNQRIVNIGNRHPSDGRPDVIRAETYEIMVAHQNQRPAPSRPYRLNNQWFHLWGPWTPQEQGTCHDQHHSY